MIKKSKKIFVLTASSILALTACCGCAIQLDEEKPLKMPSSEMFNQGEYVQPDYDVDGKADEAVWKNAPKMQYGSTSVRADGDVIFSWYYGERGITGFFDVADEYVCHDSAKSGMSTLFNYSDYVGICIDVEKNGQDSAQTDDYWLRFCADGSMQTMCGTGTGYSATTKSVDYVVVVDGTVNRNDVVDGGWSVEFFMPYSVFRIDKDATVNAFLMQADTDEPGDRPTYYDLFMNNDDYIPNPVRDYKENWHISIFSPSMYVPIDKNGTAWTAPDGWIGARGEFVSDEQNELVSTNPLALAYNGTDLFENGSGTYEATLRFGDALNFFDYSKFSGMIFGLDVKSVEKREAFWEEKDYYGVLISNSRDNPQLVFASLKNSLRLKPGSDGNIYQKLASSSISDVLPNWNDLGEITVRVSKNGGWIEVDMKDGNGEYQQMITYYDSEPLNGNYVGVRTAVKGFAVKDVSITTDKPNVAGFIETNEQYTLESGLWVETEDGTIKGYNNSRLLDNEQSSKLKDKYAYSFNVGVKTTENSSHGDDKIKGVRFAYDESDGSHFVLDFRWLQYSPEAFGERYETLPEYLKDYEGYVLYLRRYDGAGWIEADYFQKLDANTWYDFKVDVVHYLNGTRVTVNYKELGETDYRQTERKFMNYSFEMAGRRIGYVADWRSGVEFSKIDVEVEEGVRLETDSRYQVNAGLWLENSDGELQGFESGVLMDKTVSAKLADKDVYTLNVQMKIPAATTEEADNNRFKSVILNQSTTDGSYFLFDYRWRKFGQRTDSLSNYEGYLLYLRRFDGTAWREADWIEKLELNDTWYDFRIKISNTATSVSISVEYRTSPNSEYVTAERSLSYTFAMNGRNVGYCANGQTGISFKPITVLSTTTALQSNEKYTVKSGAWEQIDDGRLIGYAGAELIDNEVSSQVANKSAYTICVSMKTTENKPANDANIKGIMFNYNPTDGSYLILDFRWREFGERADSLSNYKGYLLYLRRFDGTSWREADWLGKVDAETWYDFEISVTNTANSFSVSLKYKKSNETELVAAERGTLSYAFGVTGRQVGFHIDWQSGMEVKAISLKETTGA